MSELTELFSPYIGKEVIDASDEIAALAAKHGLTVNIMDPVFNPSNIMTDPKRLDVHTTETSIIRSFTVG